MISYRSFEFVVKILIQSVLDLCCYMVQKIAEKFNPLSTA